MPSLDYAELLKRLKARFDARLNIGREHDAYKTPERMCAHGRHAPALAAAFDSVDVFHGLKLP